MDAVSGAYVQPAQLVSRIVVMKLGFQQSTTRNRADNVVRRVRQLLEVLPLSRRRGLLQRFMSAPNARQHTQPKPKSKPLTPSTQP